MFNLPTGVLYIVKALKAGGAKAYVVGGGIRDLLMGKPVYDWDITTDASPEEVEKIFSKDKVIPTGIKYGTVTIILDTGEFEVTTFRQDELYSDGRRPDKVTYTKSIEEDLKRRDFTVNAIAYDPVEDKLIDISKGQEDIKKKLIRAVGDPAKRFREDGLRCLRACRFAAKLGFEIEKKTLSAIPKTLDIFKKVSPERIHDELMKMMTAEKPSIGIEYMRKSGLLKIVIPELEEGLGVEQPKPFHIEDVYYHNLSACDCAPAELPVVRLAALFHDIAKPGCKKEDTFYNHDQVGEQTAETIMKRLKFSNEDIKASKNLIKNHMFNYTNEWGDSAVRRFINRVGVDNLEDLFLLRNADLKAMKRESHNEHVGELKVRIKKILTENDALSVAQLKVDGKDVMEALNIPPGPKVGEILNVLLEKVLDDPSLNSREKLTELIGGLRQK